MDDKVSVSELNRITGRDRATIGRLLKNLPFESGAKQAKMYDRKTALTILMTDNPSSSTGSAIMAKERRELAEAERSELRVAQIKGELVSAHDMRSAAAELVKTLFQRIVRVEPSIIASKCVGKSVIEIETTVRDSMATVFNELKLDLTSFISVDDIIPETDDPVLTCTKCGAKAHTSDEAGDFCDKSLSDSPTDRCDGRFE